MTLTPLSSLESARKKFLMNSTYIMSRKWESNVFRRPKCSNTHLAGGKKMTLTPFFARNDFAVRIGKKKIFDELDVHHV